MNVTVALLSALVVLPPMLVWADERGWVSKGMLDRGHDHHDPDGHHAGAPAATGGGVAPADARREP
jgi:hypothetical protein